MRSEEIRVVDVDTSNIDDLVSVCSFKKLSDPIHKMGVDLKKEWVKDMLQTYGSCAKIAYLDGIPCGQILHYAEELDPLVTKPRKRAIQVQCIFTSRPEARRRGVAKALLSHFLKDIKQPMACFHNQPCSLSSQMPSTLARSSRNGDSSNIWASRGPVSYTHLTLPTKRIV